MFRKRDGGMWLLDGFGGVSPHCRLGRCGLERCRRRIAAGGPRSSIRRAMEADLPARHTEYRPTQRAANDYDGASDMSLENWHNRMHKQFAALAGQRAACGRAVFALEHGLQENEIQTLETDVRESLKVRSPSDAFWLPWVVYATEVGYKYDGEEYWQTFEQTTPGWTTCRAKPREWLRDRFVGFHKTYKGMRPSGRWASNFPIIAWPIQHAVLPGYLQYHLAKLLYELRFDFTARLLSDPDSLGHYIHAESGRSVKRLQEFAEEHTLVGTIAAALLLSGSELASVSLLPVTLKRLITDLEREQRARTWLGGAQDEARRVSLRGISAAGRSGSTAKQPSPGMSPPITKKEIPEIEPRLLLVPEATDEWSVYLQTPDVTPLISRFPRFRDVLAASRCAVGGASDRFQSRGWLLYGPHRVPLTAWPQPGQVLLKLDKTDPELDAIMRTDSLLRPGPTWLFKIGADGTAYEVRGLAVRAGHSYVVAKASGSLPIRAPASPTRARCSGIAVARIDLPSSLNTSTCSYLDSLGLNVWQTIRVWPVGLSAPSWDGEGWAEWLVTDRLIVGITSDKPVRDVDLVLDGMPSLQLHHVPADHPSFVELPQLSLGIHRLKIIVQNSGPNPADQSGVLEFLVRAPKARLDAYRSLFRVSVDPERASLDDLWRGAVTIEVHGPEGRTVTPIIELCSGSAPTPLARKVMPTITMPAPASVWKKVFRDHCDGDPALDNEFDAAKYCKLQFDAAELGTTTLLFEHECRPLRWLVQREGRGLQLRLVNEGLDIDAAVVDFYPYENPDQPKTSPAKVFYNATKISPPSGLFVASCGDTRTGMITPPVPVIKGFAGLGMTPQLAHNPRAVKSVESLIRLYELWATARIVHHPVSFSFRRRVLQRIELAICDLLYGEAKLLGSTPLSDMTTNEGARSILQKIARSIPEGAVRAIVGTLGSEMLAQLREDRGSRSGCEGDIFESCRRPTAGLRSAVRSPGTSHSDRSR